VLSDVRTARQFSIGEEYRLKKKSASQSRRS
jgi:hypothetical protein